MKYAYLHIPIFAQKRTQHVVSDQHNQFVPLSDLWAFEFSPRCFPLFWLASAQCLKDSYCGASGRPFALESVIPLLTANNNFAEFWVDPNPVEVIAGLNRLEFMDFDRPYPRFYYPETNLSVCA